MFFLNIWAMHVCLLPAEVRRVSDPLKIELQMVVSHHKSARNQTQVLCKGNNYS